MMEGNQSQPPQPPIENPTMAKNEQKTPNFKSKLSFLIIAVLLVLLGLAGGYIFFGQGKLSQNKTATPANQQTSSQTSSQTTNQPTSTPTPTFTPMKTYTSEKLDSVNFPTFSLKHTSDWAESADKTEVTWKLTLTKNGYTMAIYQAPMGGSGCIYEGTMPDGPYADKRNTPYVDIKALIGDLRRNDEGAGSGKESFSFCQKSSSDNSYGSFTNVGVISYSTPINPDKTMLSEMDSIIKTIQTQ